MAISDYRKAYDLGDEDGCENLQRLLKIDFLVDILVGQASSLSTQARMPVPLKYAGSGYKSEALR